MPDEKIEKENEKKKSEDLKKSETILTKQNAAQYSPKNIKSKDQEEIRVSTERVKVVERVTYRNGVVKSRIVGVLKKGKIIYNAGIDKKFLPGNKK